jgi:hypothetical protein
MEMYSSTIKCTWRSIQRSSGLVVLFDGAEIVLFLLCLCFDFSVAPKEINSRVFIVLKNNPTSASYWRRRRQRKAEAAYRKCLSIATFFHRFESLHIEVSQYPIAKEDHSDYFYLAHRSRVGGH